MSQPTAVRPCRCELVALLHRPEEDDGARHRHREPRTSPPPRPQPSAAPNMIPSSVAMMIWPIAPGTRHGAHGGQVVDREVDPDAEHQQDDADVGELRGDRRIRDETRRERPDDHAGEDVAEDRWESQSPGDAAADERGRRGRRDRRDENGLVVHGSSRVTGVMHRTGAGPCQAGPDTIPDLVERWRSGASTGSAAKRMMGLSIRQSPVRREGSGSHRAIRQREETLACAICC